MPSKKYDNFDHLVLAWPGSNPASLSMIAKALRKTPKRFCGLRVQSFPPAGASETNKLFVEILSIAKVKTLEAPSFAILAQAAEIYFDKREGLRRKTRQTLSPLSVGGLGTVDISNLHKLRGKRVYVPAHWWRKNPRISFSDMKIRYKREYRSRHAVKQHMCNVKILTWWLRTHFGIPPEIVEMIMKRLFFGRLVTLDGIPCIRLLKPK